MKQIRKNEKLSSIVDEIGKIVNSINEKTENSGKNDPLIYKSGYGSSGLGHGHDLLQLNEDGFICEEICAIKRQKTNTLNASIKYADPCQLNNLYSLILKFECEYENVFGRKLQCLT